jgi:hypothetical protein
MERLDDSLLSIFLKVDKKFRKVESKHRSSPHLPLQQYRSRIRVSTLHDSSKIAYLMVQLQTESINGVAL